MLATPTVFECVVSFEPTSLKRHRHRMMGSGIIGTYDPSQKDKREFVQRIPNLPELDARFSCPLKCDLTFFCKRPKAHFNAALTGLKDSAPKFNTNHKDLDNMVKFVLDALNGVLYVDDRQIVDIHCAKVYENTFCEEGHIQLRFEAL